MMNFQTAIACCAAAAILAGCHNNNCNTVRDCAASQRCVSSACQDVGVSPGQLGDSCRTVADCSGGLTCAPASAGFPSGMCSADCSAAACPTASSRCAQLSTGAQCAPTCTSDAVCRQGYTCCPSQGAVCLPTSLCVPPTCSRPVVASTLPSQVIAFGLHQVGDRLSVPVPANTGSITIVHQAKVAGLTVVFKGQTIDNSAVPGIVSQPDGTVVYNDFTFNPPQSPDGGFEPAGYFAYYGGATPTTAAFTLPNTSTSLDAGIAAGNWQFTVNDYALECMDPAAGCTDGGVNTNFYDMSVLLRAKPAGTFLDVAFYIVANVNTRSGVPFTATIATNDADAQRMVKTFKALYAAAGITVRNLTFYDVQPGDRARFGTNINADATGPCDELDQMFTLSAAHPGNTMNLFLVQSIRSTSSIGGSVVGIDGTIPGPSSLSGTVHSGAAVSLADLFAGTCVGTQTDLVHCGPDNVAYIGAHETGHFLGLFHLTEKTGDYFDPLNDTPKCPCTTCASASDKPNCGSKPGPGEPTLSAVQCLVSPSCSGGDNLMFWQLDRLVSTGWLSPQQAAVMRLNPLVQ